MYQLIALSYPNQSNCTNHQESLLNTTFLP